MVLSHSFVWKEKWGGRAREVPAESHARFDELLADQDQANSLKPAPPVPFDQMIIQRMSRRTRHGPARGEISITDPKTIADLANFLRADDACLASWPSW